MAIKAWQVIQDEYADAQSIHFTLDHTEAERVQRAVNDNLRESGKAEIVEIEIYGQGERDTRFVDYDPESEGCSCGC